MKSKAIFLIHARESLKDDYTGLGLDVANIDEAILESFCLALPPSLIPLNQVGGDRIG